MSTHSEVSSNLRPTFQTRTATDIAGKLSRRNSIFPSDQAAFSGGDAAPWHSFFTRRNGHAHDIEANENTPLLRERAPSARRSSRSSFSGRRQSVTKSSDGGDKKAKPGSLPRPVGGHEKLSTFSGVFVPTCLNVLSILMFIRFGLILGQAGVVGTMGMLVASYSIDLITIFSLSAIASNGTVRGGGAYYLISRSLGPEFGGSIGLVFYLGLVFNTSLNAVGLIDAIQNNFGAVSGNWANVLPESLGYNYLWSTVVLMICTAICLGGSAAFARASNGLLVILLVATFSIPLSGLFMEPFEDLKLGVRFTGLSLTTFKENLWPHFTKGAAGSQLKGKENFQDLFGILFPATSGIFAGASMSGDLKTPSKSIPKGTLWALLLTFVSYTLVIHAMAATTTRSSFISDLNVIQDTNMSGSLVLAGEFATTFFSTLMGVTGASKLMQALARDELFPGLKIFGQGTKRADEPIYAIFATYAVAQAIMLFDINQIASFITMTYLMTFLVMNLATFLLKIGSAPNFRPSFHFFTWQTALGGALASGTAMFFVDGLYASACVAILLILFLLVHYTSRPRAWGDVSQSLIYHQVRKYLLRLKPEHVKFWRPQILLFVNDPRRQYKLIQFCNSMKKGSLYILGHVIVSNDFGSAVPEARRQQDAWSKYIDFSKIKAFVNIAISPGFEWGARNLALSAGLGGMRPNIAVLGFYNMDDLYKSQFKNQAGGSTEAQQEEAIAEPAQTLTNPPSTNQYSKIERVDSNGKGRKGNIPTLRADSTLPTDSCKTESSTSVTSYVTILEDLLLRLQINVAIARGFQSLEIPSPDTPNGNKKKFIDLWPIQMSAEIATSGAGGTKANLLTTNFDTYTLILQLGFILHTVPSWRKSYKLRVCVFVEYESDVEDERHRVEALLENLRIEAKILVFWLASGNLPTYEVIINGRHDNDEEVEEVEQCLRCQEWWEEIQRIRGNRGDPSPGEELDKNLEGVIGAGGVQWPDASFQQGPRHEKVERFLELRKLLHRNRRRRSLSVDVSGFEQLGVRLGMRTQRLPLDLVEYGVESEESESDTEDESAASEADMSDFESDSEPAPSPVKITRRRSHGDTLRGPRPFKKSTGERHTTAITDQPKKTGSSNVNTPARSLRIEDVSEEGPKESTAEFSNLDSREEISDDVRLMPPPQLPFKDGLDSPKKLEDRPASVRPSSDASSPSSLRSPTKPKSGNMSPTKIRVRGLAAPDDERPILSRHASTQKFSSKPVPVTQVRDEEGPGPSIMFVDTPSPPAKKGRGRLGSAYRIDGGGDGKEEVRVTKAQKEWEVEAKTKEKERLKEEAKRGVDSSRADSPTPSRRSMASRRGSTYSTQSLPLSFNDLPCRAQHLILNQLMRQNSKDTTVLFTTLPSPVEGTGLSEERSLAWLNDLEVLGHGLEGLGVASVLVHSNSMTVTMSL